MAGKKKGTVVPNQELGFTSNASEYINQVYMSMPKEDQKAFDEKVDTLLQTSKNMLKDELYHMATGAPKVDDPIEEKPKRRRKKTVEETTTEAPSLDQTLNKDESK